MDTSNQTAVPSPRLPPQAVSITVITMATACILLGTFGNARILLHLYKRRRLRNVPHYLLANLSVTGLLSMTVNLPSLVVILIVNYLLDRRVSLELICATGGTLALPVSILNSATLSIMAIDSQDRVLRPLQLRLTRDNIKKVILMVWIVTAVLTVPSAVMMLQEGSVCSRIVPYNSLRNKYSNTPSRLYVFGVGTLLSVATFLVITITFFRVIKRLRSPVVVPHTNAWRLRTENRIIKLTYQICAAFLAAWLPLITVNVVARVAQVDANVTGTLRLFVIVISHLNYAVNPLLYFTILKIRPQNVRPRREPGET